MLKVYDDIPDGFLDAPPTAMGEILGGPSLIHIPGRRNPPLFVTTLLHGNETTGIEALQALLKDWSDRTLPRALTLFIGNVQAARHGVRRLDHQPDYNRVWPGTSYPDCPERRLMAEVVARQAARGVFASLDIHNNTGRNPFYGCVNRLDARYLFLASLFSRTLVYFTRPRGVQSLAMAELCPAVTVECGQPGSPKAAAHARAFIEDALHLQEIPDHIEPADLGVYHTVGTVRIPRQNSFGFERDDVDLQLLPDLDDLNFHDLPAGTAFCRVRPNSGAFLSVEDNAGREACDDYFVVQDGEIRLRRPMMPAMLTRNERVIRQDCLCYLMERLHAPLPGHD